MDDERPGDRDLPLGSEAGWYTTNELSVLLGVAIDTLQDWCLLGRLNASYSQGNRHHVWRVSAEEVERYRAEGLLPRSRLRNYIGKPREECRGWKGMRAADLPPPRLPDPERRKLPDPIRRRERLRDLTQAKGDL